MAKRSKHVPATCGVPSMEPYCETKQVEFSDNRSGSPCKIGRNRSELVKLKVELSQMPLETPQLQGNQGRDPRNHEIFLTEKGSMAGRHKLLANSHRGQIASTLCRRTISGKKVCSSQSNSQANYATTLEFASCNTVNFFTDKKCRSDLFATTSLHDIRKLESLKLCEGKTSQKSSK